MATTNVKFLLHVLKHCEDHERAKVAHTGLSQQQDCIKAHQAAHQCRIFHQVYRLHGSHDAIHGIHQQRLVWRSLPG